MPTASVDVVLADPPYSSGGQSQRERNRPTSEKYRTTGVASSLPEFAGDSRDQLSHVIWSSLWLGEAFRLTRAGGLAFVWTDWRQLAATVAAVQAGGWTYRGVVVWDKGTASRPVRGRFRLNVEFAVWASAGAAPSTRAVYPSAVVTCAPPKRRMHIAQKPVAVLEHLLSIAEPRGVVLDPFVGSGSSLEAARSIGMSAIGVELLPSLCDTAIERLAAFEGSGRKDSRPKETRRGPPGTRRAARSEA